MTPAQLATLKAAILADPELAALPNTDDGNFTLAEMLTQPAAPAFIVWRPDVTADEIFDQVRWTGTGGYIARSAGERDAFAVLMARGTLDFSKNRIRGAFDDIFSGAATEAVATRAAIAAVAKRPATRGEKIFATGTGTDADPAKLTPITISPDDVEAARAA